jgi:hypothetical protein
MGKVPAYFLLHFPGGLRLKVWRKTPGNELPLSEMREGRSCSWPEFRAMHSKETMTAMVSVDV